MSISRSLALPAVLALLVFGTACDVASLTNPSPGDRFRPGDVVPITAVGPSQSSIHRVEFYDGNEMVAVDGTAPYEHLWIVGPDDVGPHAWSAQLHFVNDSGETAMIPTAVVPVEVLPAEPTGSPGVVGFVPGIGTAEHVALAGGEAFVSSSDFGLSIVDPSGPELLASSAQPFGGMLSAVSGDQAVSAGRDAEGHATLWVLDLSGTRPAQVGSYETQIAQGDPLGFQGLALDAGRGIAVAAMGLDGVWVFDVSDPAAPARIATFATPSTAYAVELDGDVAYVAASIGDLQVLDLADPTRPRLLASLSLSGVSRDLARVGDRLYVSVAGGGLLVVDVADPSAPRMVGLAGTAVLGTHVAADADWAVVRGQAQGQARIEVFSLANPSFPQSVSSVEVAEVLDVAVADGKVFVPDGLEGVKVYAVGTLASQGSLLDVYEASVVGEAGGLAVIAADHVPTDRSRLLVVDSSDPANPQIRGELETDLSSSSFKDIEVDAARGLAVASAGGAGVWIVDLSLPEQPRLLADLPISGGAIGLALAGTRAFVAAGVGDLQIVDLTDPTRPTLLGSKSLTGVQMDVAVVGDLAYLSASSGGVNVVDVSDPTAPRRVGGAGTAILGTHLSAEAGHLVVRGSGSGSAAVEFFDLADPTDPVSRAVVGVDAVSDLVVRAGRVWVPDGLFLKVFDAASGSLVASETGVGPAQDISVAGDLACLADLRAVLAIVRPAL